MTDIQKLQFFCDNPTFKNFQKLYKDIILKLYMFAMMSIKDKIGNIFICGKIIEYFSIIYLESDVNNNEVYQQALDKLSPDIQIIMKNQYNKTHKSLNRHVVLDNSGIEEFSDCLSFTVKYDDENLCIYNDRRFISDNVNKWKALEIRAIYLGYRPVLKYNDGKLLKGTFVNYWAKSN